MKLRTLRKIARATVIVCIAFNIFGLYALWYTAFNGNPLLFFAILVYLPVASLVEFWFVKRIWEGKLLGILWE